MQGLPRIICSLEQALLVAFAVSLPLSHTLCVVIWISGIVLLLSSTALQRFFSTKDFLPGKSPEQTESVGSSLKISEETEKPRTSLPPLTVPIIVLVVAIAASGFANGGIDEAVRSARKITETILPYFWVYFVCQRNPLATGLAVTALIWVSAIAGVYGSIQQVFDYHPTKFKYLQGTGFMAHPMAFAGQMQIFSMLSLGLLLSNGYTQLSQKCSVSLFKSFLYLSQNKFVFPSLVLCNFAGLFFAVERSAWLGGAAGVLAIASLRSLSFGGLSFLGLSALGSLLYFLVPVFRLRIDLLFSGHDISLSVRQKIWTKCWSIIQQSPFFGVGWLKFPHFDEPEAIVPGVSKDLNHAHSNYMQILTTTGALGLLSYLILLACIVTSAAKKFLRLQNQDQFNAGLALGVFGATVSLAVSGIFEFNFGASVQVRLAQWFVLGLF